MNNMATETRSVIVEREIAFPPEKIWRALTQPHLIEEWLMKNDFKPVVDHRFNHRGVVAAVRARRPRGMLSEKFRARGQSPGDDALETHCAPRVRQRFVRLDGQDLTVDGAPVSAKIETVAHDSLEVVLHEPLLDQVWLRERAPDLFRRIRYLPFDNEGERFGRRFAHWSILLSQALFGLF